MYDHCTTRHVTPERYESYERQNNHNNTHTHGDSEKLRKKNEFVTVDMKD